MANQPLQRWLVDAGMSWTACDEERRLSPIGLALCRRDVRCCFDTDRTANVRSRERLPWLTNHSKDGLSMLVCHGLHVTKRGDFPRSDWHCADETSDAASTLTGQPM